MSVLPAGSGALAALAYLPRWVLATLATLGLPGFLWMMKELSQVPWMEGPGLISLVPVLLGAMGVILVFALWHGVWMDWKEAKKRQTVGET